MSEQTILTGLKSTMSQVGGEAWVEELLIRGAPSGIRGAHVTLGWSAPLMGSGTNGPHPLTIETDDPLWEQVKSDLDATAVQQVVDLSAQLDTAQQEIGSLTDRLQAAESEIGQLTEQLQAAQDRIAELEQPTPEVTET